VETERDEMARKKGENIRRDKGKGERKGERRGEKGKRN